MEAHAAPPHAVPDHLVRPRRCRRAVRRGSKGRCLPIRFNSTPEGARSEPRALAAGPPCSQCCQTAANAEEDHEEQAVQSEVGVAENLAQGRQPPALFMRATNLALGHMAHDHSGYGAKEWTDAH